MRSRKSLLMFTLFGCATAAVAAQDVMMSSSSGSQDLPAQSGVRLGSVAATVFGVAGAIFGSVAICLASLCIARKTKTCCFKKVNEDNCYNPSFTTNQETASLLREAAKKAKKIRTAQEDAQAQVARKAKTGAERGEETSELSVIIPVPPPIQTAVVTVTPVAKV